MPLTTCSVTTSNIAALADLPNDDDGLTPAQLKAKFDQAGTDLKGYINNTLIPELESTTDGNSGADKVGATAISGLTGGNVQALLEALKNKVDSVNPVAGFYVVTDPTYGVKGDGTDESSVIQSVLNAVNNNGGGVVYFPKPQTKYVAVNLNVYSNTIIVADGWQTIIEQKTTAVDTDCLFNIIGGSGGISENKRNIVFRDIQLKGKVDIDPFVQYKHLVKIFGGSDILFERVKFSGWIGDGAYIGYGGTPVYHNENITFRKCLFDGVNKGNRNAISLIDCDGFLIDDCDFINTTKADMPGAIDIEPNTTDTAVVLNHVTVRNSRFYNIGGNVAAVGMYIPIASGAFTNRNPKNFTFENNEMDGVFKGFHIAQYQTADLTESQDGLNIKIINNKVKNATDRGFWLYGVKDVTLRDNLFEDIANSNRIGWSLSYRNCVGIKLIDNTFRKCATTDGEAIKIFTSERIDLIGAIFDDCGASAGGYGVCLSFESGTTSKVRIIGMTIVTPTGKTTGAIAKKGGAVLTPSTNVFKHNDLGSFLNIAFDADVTDYGYTSTTFDGTTLPDSFKRGVTTLKVTGSSGLPTGFTDGILVTNRPSELSTDREYTTQYYYPKNAGGASLTEVYYRKANDGANTWSAWHKITSVAV